MVLKDGEARGSVRQWSNSESDLSGVERTAPRWKRCRDAPPESYRCGVENRAGRRSSATRPTLNRTLAVLKGDAGQPRRRRQVRL